MAFLYPLEQSHKQQKTDDDYFDLQTTASAEWTKDQPTHSSVLGYSIKDLANEGCSSGAQSTK